MKDKDERYKNLCEFVRKDQKRWLNIVLDSIVEAMSDGTIDLCDSNRICFLLGAFNGAGMASQGVLDTCDLNDAAMTYTKVAEAIAGEETDHIIEYLMSRVTAALEEDYNA